MKISQNNIKTEQVQYQNRTIAENTTAIASLQPEALKLKDHIMSCDLSEEASLICMSAEELTSYLH